MSGIAGIYNLDGRPVDKALLQRMTDVIAHRGPDRFALCCDGPIGLGHRMLCTTPESLGETQPLLDETTNLVLVLDGRVDNRAELKNDLEAKGAVLRDDTDAELFLKAYACWGEECPARIIGDFAVAVWDRRASRLFCARDALGIKPFYYTSDGRTFLCGSEIQQLFQDPAVRRAPNEGMIGEYLAAAITSVEETLYQGVVRLPPAHFLIVTPHDIQKRRYWDLDPTRRLRYRSDGEYVEHFRQVFREAVRCRMRSLGPVAAHLSGGADSSSVVSIANSLWRESCGVLPSLETITVVFPGLPCDESVSAHAVVQTLDLKSHLVPAKELNGAADQVRRYGDFPDYPNIASFSISRAWAREKGFRVVLTGEGGDDLFRGRDLHYADLLLQLRLPELLRHAWTQGENHGPGSVCSSLFWGGLVPFIPPGPRRFFRPLLRRKEVPDWIAPAFARRIQLSERIRPAARERPGASFAQIGLCDNISSAWGVHTMELLERSAAWFGVEERHPLYNRPLVEFALTIPEEQRYRGAEQKLLLRQVLPPQLRHNRTCVDFSLTFVEGLQAHGGLRIFDDLAIDSIGWVDRKKCCQMLRQMIEKYRKGDEDYPRLLWPLWLIFGIDLWFKTVY